MDSETRDGLPSEAAREADLEKKSDAGFEIDGESYAIPRLDTITLDEERILYIYADTVLQDFMPANPADPAEAQQAYLALQMRKLRNPEFKRALAHIAYKRQHPELDDSSIQSAIGKVSALEVDIAIIKGSADDNPPASNSLSEHSSRSDTNEPSRSEAFGSHTANGSEQAAEIPEAIGIIESATSSRPSVPIE